MSNTRLPEDLEEFVSKEVASLCDADPAVLAQYIVALIGNEPLDDSLKSSLESKLNEFFDDQTLPFIDRLFAKIKGDDSSKQSSNKDEHFADLSDDEDDGDRNFKHRRQRAESREECSRGGSSKRRLDDECSVNNTNTNKYQRADERRSNMNPNSIPVTGYGAPAYDNNRNGRGASRSVRGGRGGSGGIARNQGNRPQCRDYNEKGFCMRGDLCPYDHGIDRIIVDESSTPFSANPFPNNGNIPPMGPGGQPFFAMPGIADAYDPERSGLIPTNEMGQFLPVTGMLPPNNDIMAMNNMMRNNNLYKGRGGRGTGRGGRGGRGGYQRNQQSQNPLNTTLNVEKIPSEFCQIATVNEFFSKFGTITNISVQPHAHKAVIQYSTRAEAERAYSSPDAIFDNRFVKVYWAKEENPTQASEEKPPVVEAPQPPAPPKVNEPDPELVAARAAELAQVREEKQKRHQERMKQLLEIQKRREAQLKQQIDEQKRLLSKLENSTDMTQAEKAELLKALKNIQNDINVSKSAAASATAASEHAKNANVDGNEGSEANITESSEEKNSSAETTEELKKKLARLEAEAAALGVSGSGFRGGRGGYYGRGRGWPRMRGGMTRMTLDNRPTKLVARNIPQEFTEADLHQHFEQFGNITTFEKTETELYVQYSQRYEAEKAMTLGPNFTKGKLQLDWVPNNTSATSANLTTTVASNADTNSNLTEGA
ncbi:uncharacterized protein BX663DRAFT_544230 [Cokeromyces recurvatus]|uniref:uncharacterized protein n=1 Tax=Cokeromyces recurvatus TaxID=90255 RepID=UPI00221F1FBF|nr:uncharacterized protein BX663DRAFT_544230 [Cokeromyces recurvatus]KAI7901497.1 hypothetical protein BX663DRAFT_544230 [Cokeromyces recurvatus]